jgi:quinoprotein glucose dehydrogenase
MSTEGAFSRSRLLPSLLGILLLLMGLAMLAGGIKLVTLAGRGTTCWPGSVLACRAHC